MLYFSLYNIAESRENPADGRCNSYTCYYVQLRRNNCVKRKPMKHSGNPRRTKNEPTYGKYNPLPLKRAAFTNDL